jgi:hypothetical protein
MDTNIMEILLANIFNRLHIECERACPPQMIVKTGHGPMDYTIKCEVSECPTAKLQHKYRNLLKDITFKEALSWIDHPIMGEVAAYITQGTPPEGAYELDSSDFDSQDLVSAASTAADLLSDIQ